MAYCLDQFGPALKLPWTRLVAPELTAELRNAMVDGCIEMTAGQDFASLSKKMNEGLVEIAKIKRRAKAQQQGNSSGGTLNE